MLCSKELISENGVKIIIRFSFYEQHNNIVWKINDVQYKRPRQKIWRFLNNSFTDKYEYRKLSLAEREQYAYERYKEFCGEEIIKKAYQDVYDRIKPDILV